MEVAASPDAVVTDAVTTRPEVLTTQRPSASVRTYLNTSTFRSTYMADVLTMTLMLAAAAGETVYALLASPTCNPPCMALPPMYSASEAVVPAGALKNEERGTDDTVVLVSESGRGLVRTGKTAPPV